MGLVPSRHILWAQPSHAHSSGAGYIGNSLRRGLHWQLAPARATLATRSDAGYIGNSLRRGLHWQLAPTRATWKHPPIFAKHPTQKSILKNPHSTIHSQLLASAAFPLYTQQSLSTLHTNMQYPDLEFDVPLADYPPTFEGLQERVDAAFNTLATLADQENIDRFLVSDVDISTARAVVEQQLKPTEAVLSTPGVILHIKTLLDTYDKAVLQSSAQLRTYVTNRLIEDSGNPDPRIRLKCYELLGKISDVGLFTDKTEITMKHRPTEELEQLLRERLMRTIDADPVPLPTVEGSS